MTRCSAVPARLAGSFKRWLVFAGVVAPWRAARIGLVLALMVLMVPNVEAQETVPLNLETATLMRLINEARTVPLAMLQRAGIDETAARHALGPDAWMLDTGLPPLAPNDLLAASARFHAADMVARAYYDTRSPEGLGPEERAAALGYGVVRVDELLGLLDQVAFMDGLEAVWTVFRQWLLADLAAFDPAQRRLFSLWATDMGVHFQAVTGVVDGREIHAYLAVCDVGRPLKIFPMVVGSVRPHGFTGPFLDPWNPLTEPFSVRCRSDDGTLWWETRTDPLGGYICPALSEWQAVVVEGVNRTTGQVVAAERAAAGDVHVWLDLFPTR
ncbi:CAP domain-containing protein [Desulfosoma caldarium]|uniref:SCP domain-containing protein n=1 Tax=Desulfosoma caldarium TaxID=610254 RepID=A0A3N1VK22_9BACT|nr:CAP domain-containing protein [Desulfosoma caldarium]ROR03165.1 hypothetical protein EDC27_0423 [Desulfosoma caldarium]